MKKILSISLIIISTIVLFSSCGKYEEGPELSLLTKKARLTGKWQVEKIFQGDNLIYYHDEILEITDTNNSDEIKAHIKSLIYYYFNKNGKGNRTNMIKIMDGNMEDDELELDVQWEFSNSKEDLKMRIKSIDNAWEDWTDYEIIRLTNKELRLQTFVNGIIVKMELKKQK